MISFRLIWLISNIVLLFEDIFACYWWSMNITITLLFGLLFIIIGVLLFGIIVSIIVRIVCWICLIVCLFLCVLDWIVIIMCFSTFDAFMCLLTFERNNNNNDNDNNNNEYNNKNNEKTMRRMIWILIVRFKLHSLL